MVNINDLHSNKRNLLFDKYNRKKTTKTVLSEHFYSLFELNTQTVINLIWKTTQFEMF